MSNKVMHGGAVHKERSSVAVIAALVGGAILLIGLQIAATREGLVGPIWGLIREYGATPALWSVPWAGLAVAMVGLSNRRRTIALSAALVVDIVVLGIRLIIGNRLALGSGPLIVLTVLTIYAAVRWSDHERVAALRACALGFLLIVAAKVAATFLPLTALTRPMVLDEYAKVADHALGNPSWLVFQVVDALGPVGNGIIHVVYNELPLATMVVAFWQLRNIRLGPEYWPSHYLVRTFLVMAMIGPLFYFVFPLVGPVYAFSTEGNGYQVSDIWPHIVPTIDVNPVEIPFDDETPRNCMPSMHTAWALAIFVHSRGGPRWLRYLGAFWLVGTLTATLGFGYHYGVDLLAGAFLFLCVESALRDSDRGWGWFRIRLVVSFAVLMLVLMWAVRYLAVQMAQYAQIAGPLLVATMAAAVVAFYATFYARPDSTLGIWGRRPVEATSDRDTV
nr:DUF5933 domain-containing protein [Antrihabitans stalagmiti]